MAIIVLKRGNLKQIKKFDLKCKKCGSSDIHIEIDWASYPSDDYRDITIICNKCKEDETLYNY